MIFRRRDRSEAEREVPESSEGVLDRLRGGPRTVIGSQTRFRGTLSGRGTVLVCGTLRGGIDLAGPLAVAPGGWVEANVAVETARVGGRVKGSLRASESLRVDPSGRLEGEIESPIIDLHAGSILRGRASIAGTSLRRTTRGN
jgi:cytoskeletal protein CcmA (bactofilin family)